MEYILTPTQQNFYTDDSLKDIPIWNLGGISLFPYDYSYVQLNDAFNSMIETHEHLRMHCILCSGEIKTQLSPFQFKQYPYRRFSSEEEFLTFAQEFVNEPLDIFKELFRCILVSMPGKSGILVCVHHILIDGYSGPLIGAFLEYYLENGEPSSLPLQSYEKHMEAEIQYLSTVRYQADADYWKNVFSTQPVRSVFSGRSNSADYSCQEFRTTVSSDLFAKIESSCKDLSLYPSTLFYTALAGYIQREYRHHHFTIGMPVYNRTSRAEANTIGLYMHVLPIIVNLSDDSFLSNAKKLEREKLKVLRHSKMVQNPTPALFDVVLNYQPFAEDSGSYELGFLYSNALSTALEIHIHNTRDGNQRVIIRYRTSYFTEGEIKELWNRVMNIITYAIIHPDTAIQEIPQYNLSLEERQELVFELNNTSFDYEIPDSETLYSLFEKTALENQSHICLTGDGFSYTFEEFLSYVQALDSKIYDFTNGCKSVIAVLTERSPEMYTSIYAAIRGGNAYLPISPDDPPERIQFLLEDSKASLVLTQNKFLGLTGNIPAIDVTTFLQTPDCKENLMPANVCLDDTAYIIYTSGSTGKPKGVKISHRSLVNRILWMQDSYPVDKNSIILQKTPYTFDVSLWEIFWWGICGCTMAASRPGEHFLPAKILESVHKYQVTHLHFVPSVFDLFLTYLENHKEKCECFSSVKHVFLSGEALNASLVHRFYALFSYENIKLHNLYGPTECTVDVTSYDCTPNDMDPIPIGKPIYNTSIYILDQTMELLPKGMIGELCIGGINVGQGYLNNPELTSEKFVPNPFAPGMLYRTGDYARIREDGQLVFCGRMDGQRKLNGQRIELSEIESIIQKMQDVESVVTDIRNHNEQDILAVYYCGNASKESIQELCKRTLPPYMVPTLFFHLEQMPFTANGKLNRQALNELPLSISGNPIHELPQTVEESLICDAFCRILQIESVGRDNNFFSLGGTSLSMIELLSEEPFMEITAVEFIKNPTPAGLANCLYHITESTTLGKLSCLCEGSIQKDALIVFPYAGGGPESYAQLTHVSKDFAPELSIYYAEYPKDFEDCVQIARELQTLSANYTLYFYSHCAGSAAALQIIHILEERNQHIVKHYLAGANIPSKTPAKENIWQVVSDTMLKDILLKAGASFEGLSEEHILKMLDKFRINTDFYTEYFYKESGKIHCPFSLVLSKQDIFTENYPEAAKIWNHYTESVSEIYYIEDSSHYFQSSYANVLMQLIISIINHE